MGIKDIRLEPGVGTSPKPGGHKLRLLRKELERQREKLERQIERHRREIARLKLELDAVGS